jgi:hypothetical protein
MAVFLIDQWVDARQLDNAGAVRAAADATRGLASGQVAEVIVSDVLAASEILAWPESKPLEVLDSMVLQGACRVILRHR